MASEPGSAAERLHPFFAPATAQNRKAEHNGEPSQDAYIPIDPMVLAMDSNGASHAQQNSYGTPYHVPYQQHSYGMPDAAHSLPSQYAMPPSSTRPHAPSPWAMNEGVIDPLLESLVPVSDSVPEPVSSALRPPPKLIPVQNNAFALLGRRRPVEKPTASVPDELAPTPEPKKRGRPRRKPAVTGMPEAGAAASVASAAPETAAAAPLRSKAPPAFNLPPTALKVEASGDPTAPNPLQKMMKRAAHGGTPAAPAAPEPAPPVRLEAKNRYGASGDSSTARIAQTIGLILEGKHRQFPLGAHLSTKPKPAAPKPAAPKTSTPAKAHPLFAAVRSKQSSAKPQPSSASKPSPAATAATTTQRTTPSSPKRAKFFQAAANSRAPQFGVSNGLVRVPGARWPPWPSADNVHVRPDECGTGTLTFAHALQSRKRKGNVTSVPSTESLLSRQLEHLSISAVISEIEAVNADEFQPPAPELRLPTRHVESGRKLAKRVLPQLRSGHPGVKALSEALPAALSAFDRCTNETAMWTQKYAPACAADVLQEGDEVLHLKAWLEALKIVAVDTGPGEADGASSKNGAKPKAKKKRKKAKMDGFIVSSDDEGDDAFAEDDEDDGLLWTASGRFGKFKQTVVRPGNLLDKNGRAAARLNNVVVISGPHGSGKSAAVYAVAKELGFEIFEIGAGSRRTGKDVTDRIGNMTTNHLVQHKKKNPFQKTMTDEPADSVSDLEDRDGDDDPEYPAYPATPLLAPSARQKTMASFFKTNAAAPPAPPAPKVQSAVQSARPDTNAAAKNTPSEQKQSLILLEEADILYEEDKQFWATVTNLIVLSKRPFVITCTDETLIPLHLLRLHAILRLSAAPADAAVDRMLLVAASEGHAVQRQAVQGLYESRGHDLRAALTELQFWCQMTVGAYASYFDWLVKRVPAGVDCDEHGDTVRVVSENTYQAGMGWLNHDAATAATATAATAAAAGGPADAAEEAFVQQAWTDWQVDVGQWQESLDMPAWAERLAGKANDRATRLRVLEAYSSFTEDMSDADVVSKHVFALGGKERFDATEPEHPVGGPDEYPVGMTLLDRTTAVHGNDQLRLPLATSLRCLAKASLRSAVDKAVDGHEHRFGPVSNADVVAVVHRQCTADRRALLAGRPVVARIDVAEAFDPIAVRETANAAATSLEPSVFDRNMQPIIVDVAPFVRAIVAHDERVKAQRKQRGTFLAEAAGSPPGAGATGLSDGDSDAPVAPGRRAAKRSRMTRTALSALDGGSRAPARPSSWFAAELNVAAVRHTGDAAWTEALDAEMQRRTEAAAAADEAAARAAQAEAEAHARAQAQAMAFAQAQAAQQSTMGGVFVPIAAQPAQFPPLGHSMFPPQATIPPTYAAGPYSTAPLAAATPMAYPTFPGQQYPPQFAPEYAQPYTPSDVGQAFPQPVPFAYGNGYAPDEQMVDGQHEDKGQPPSTG